MTSHKPPTNPKKWRFTWEAQSHVPVLRLYLFNPDTKPSRQCLDLKGELVFEQSFLKVCWFGDQSNVEVSLRVPVPRVLIDVDSPVNFRPFDDHIEVKFVLLLPVDHPIVLNFDLNKGDELADEMKPLSMDSDLKKFSSGEEVHFYCRSCATELTKSLRYFEENPSVDWQESADNWFGTCCCSFGGISEKLVNKYAKLHACRTGLCLLSTTSAVLCKDDVVGGRFLDHRRSPEYESLDVSGKNWLRKHLLDNESEGVTAGQNRRLHAFCPGEANLAAQISAQIDLSEAILDELSSCKLQINDTGSCVDTEKLTQDHEIGCCTLHASEPPEEQIPKTGEFVANQKSFLNGYFGSSFMARSTYLSKDVQWFEFICPKCSCVVGAYPQDNSDTSSDDRNTVASVDNGVHLFKCYISTSLDVGRSTDFFRNYTLERMFTNQLLESAKDELSFRTMVMDLQTKCPMLQIILLNPNSWCSTGYCLGTFEPVPKTDLCPTIKVLFSDCSSSTEFQSRMIEEWTTKNQVDKAYMLTSQIKELTESLKLGNNLFPPSHSSLQGLSLSSLRR